MHACHTSPHIRRKHIFDWSIRLGIRLIYRLESSLKLCGIISRYRTHRTRIPMANDSEKEMAALASLKYVHDGQIVGLGSGSTATIAIRLLAERVRAGLKIRGIPTSVQSRDLAFQLGIPLTTFDECQEIDVTIDGADEFDPDLNLIKGDRKSTRLNSSHMSISYAVFCL